MALDLDNQVGISFKRLVGKAQTQETFVAAFETITSNVQISNTTIFASAIDPQPIVNGGLTSFGDTDGVVEKIRFEVEIIPDTIISVPGGAASQGYRLKLADGYNGVLSSTFSGGTFLHTALGRLQIVPTLYGSPYEAKLFRTNGTSEINKFDSINWQLDYYSGILFVQNPPNGFDTSSDRPAFVDAYLYVGDYQDSVSGSAPTGSTNVASGERISKVFNQTTHGFVFGDVIGYKNGEFIKAIADDTLDYEINGIVTSADTNNFQLTYTGYVTGLTSLNLSGETTYFLSENTAGELTETQPSGIGSLTKAMLYTYDADSGFILNQLGIINEEIPTGSTTGGTGGGVASVEFIYLTGATSYNTDGTEDTILIDTSSNPITLNLPSILAENKRFRIKDSGNASINSITIDGNSKTIDGESQITINIDYFGYEITYSVDLDAWFITGTINYSQSTNNLPPNPPTTFTANNVEGDSFTLNWDEAIDN